MLAYVVVDDPGSTWIAPFFHRGNSEVRVDDSTISPQKKIDKWGGTGQALDLTKGLHKVEIFSACDASADYSAGQGLVWFTWKPPHATVAELGGVRPTNVTFAGTSKQESRVLRTGEVVKSGDARIQEINLRDGGPVAYFTAEPKDVFWFGNDTPTIVYEFSALTTGYPTNTTYTWGFGDNAKPTGPKVVRFMTGQEEHPITLAATWSNKESRCTIPIFAYSTVKSSLDDASTRENFRMACLNMIKTYPPDTDPTVAWDKSMWDTFYAVQELGKGGQLLAEVLVNRWKHFKAKIPPEKEALLEDIFFHSISYMAPDKAIAWLEEQERTARSPERRNDLKIMLAEVYMYHKKNLQEAKKILMPLAAQGTTEVAAMASIRLGDVAFLEKNVSEANRYWGSAQNRVKLANDVLKDDEDSVKWKGDAAPEPEKAKAEPEKGKRGKEKDEPKKPLRPFMPHRDRVADWKKSAVLDTSMAAGVITLMKQGSYTDAFHELQKWERNFPTSKMSSDYILQEARFYMAIGNRQRARTSLEAYCENVDASSYLADAAELLFQCMLYDKEPDDVLTKFCEKMKKRFEFHPFAERVNSMLRQMRAGGVKMDATPDKIPNGI
jgi:tetratricopeptide (TPR) repeat protein